MKYLQTSATTTSEFVTARAKLGRPVLRWFSVFTWVFAMVLCASSRAEPVSISKAEAPRSIDGAASWMDCTDSALRYMEGVRRIVRVDGTAACAYDRVMRLAVDDSFLTFALQRSGSEHEESSFLEEVVLIFNPAGEAIGAVLQLEIDHDDITVFLEYRRFRLLSLPDRSGELRPGLCIETIEEFGPGWDAKGYGSGWAPTKRFRAADAWILDVDSSNAPLLRRPALDGLCPTTGYSRFVPSARESESFFPNRAAKGEVIPAQLTRPKISAWQAPWAHGTYLNPAMVRTAFPGYSNYAWLSDDVVGDRICAGPSKTEGDNCLLSVAILPVGEAGPMGMTIANGRRTSGIVEVRDVSFVGPDGIRIGARLENVMDLLTGCKRGEEDASKVICEVKSVPGFTLQLEGGASAACGPFTWAACAGLKRATVEALTLAPAGH